MPLEVQIISSAVIVVHISGNIPGNGLDLNSSSLQCPPNIVLFPIIINPPQGAIGIFTEKGI